MVPSQAAPSPKSDSLGHGGQHGVLRTIDSDVQKRVMGISISSVKHINTKYFDIDL